MNTKTTEKPDPIKAGLASVTTEIAAWDRIEAGFAELQQEHPVDVLHDVTTPKGMRAAIDARAAWRTPRIAVEHARKAAKAPVLELGRAIDARAKELADRLTIGEEHYDGQVKAEERRQEQIRAERAAVEARRIEAHQQAILAMRETVMACQSPTATAARIAEALRQHAGVVVDARFEEFQDQAKETHYQVGDQLQRLHAGAVTREAEAARIEAERAELVRLRAEQQARDNAERDRIAAEQAAENKRLADARAALEAEQQAARAAQARADTEAAERRRIADEEAARQRAEADRLARVNREAEAKRQADERAALERQQAELRAAEQRRLDAIAAAERAEREAAHAAQQRLRDAAEAMFDVLTQWQSAEESADDKELDNARAARDAVLGELVLIPVPA